MESTNNPRSFIIAVLPIILLSPVLWVLETELRPLGALGFAIWFGVPLVWCFVVMYVIDRPRP